MVLGVTVTPVGPGMVQVTWRQVNSEDVTGYRVYYSQLAMGSDARRQAGGGGAGEMQVTFPAASSSGVVEELEKGVEYMFQVVAVVTVSGAELEGTTRSDSSIVKVQGELRGVASVVYAVLL